MRPSWATAIALAAILLPGFALAESPEETLARELAEQQRLQQELRAGRQSETDARREADEAARREAEAEQRAGVEAAQRAYGGMIADEMATQEKLLWQATGRGEQPEALAMPTDESKTPAYLDPRTAPIPPEPRPLPREIFDVERVQVPANTWGGRSHPAYDADRLSLDADGDGQPELVRWIDRVSGELLREEADRNYDGTLDSWTIYRGGEPSLRRLDQNDDGRPDTWDEYETGRAVTRERDRDDDGVRDVFYVYEQTRLTRESHDANNDGDVDLVIHYAAGRRDKSEEDVDGDGRMDMWTTWVVDEEGGEERVGRKERDRAGDGLPDTVEVFGWSEGQAVLERREEDKNGDGRADVISIYVDGKLRKRQILEPDA